MLSMMKFGTEVYTMGPYFRAKFGQDWRERVDTGVATFENLVKKLQFLAVFWASLLFPSFSIRPCLLFLSFPCSFPSSFPSIGSRVLQWLSHTRFLVIVYFNHVLHLFYTFINVQFYQHHSCEIIEY